MSLGHQHRGFQSGAGSPDLTRGACGDLIITPGPTSFTIGGTGNYASLTKEQSMKIKTRIRGGPIAAPTGGGRGCGGGIILDA